MSRVPEFDDLVGTDVPEEERQRLRRAHELLVQAGPPPELSPAMDAVPWPDESQRPAGKPRQQRLLLLAAALATAAVLGFVLGQSSGPSSSSASIEPVRAQQARALLVRHLLADEIVEVRCPRHCNSPSSMSARRLRPARVRVLTVPSGMPRKSAISLCESSA